MEGPGPARCRVSLCRGASAVRGAPQGLAGNGNFIKRFSQIGILFHLGKNIASKYKKLMPKHAANNN